MDTRIIILSDNRTVNPLLEVEHGLSVYMEYNGRKYLLDTGASDLFIRNAEKLGVNLCEVDYCLISHELAFVIGDVLFTGCAHHGILNILESIQELIRLSIGGFHLLDSHLSEYYETDEQLQEIASELANRYPDVVFYTGHCTGDHCFEVLSREKGLRIHQFHVGKMCQ